MRSFVQLVLQVLAKEFGHRVEGNLVHAVVQIDVVGALDDQKLLLRLCRGGM